MTELTQSPSTILQYIRATRAAPPGWASATDERRAIYGAALEQFQQLLDAARTSGPASRPLTLFYALSQAGRAIVAARGEVPAVRGHGLKEHPPAKGVDSLDLLRRSVERKAWDNRQKSPPKGPSEDAFGAVSRAIGSPDFDGTVELGAAWSATPLTTPVPDGSWREDWRPYVTVTDMPPEGERSGKLGRVPGTISLMSLVGHPTIAAADGLQPPRYPTIPVETLQVVDMRRASWIEREAAWVAMGHGQGAAVLLWSTTTPHRFSEERVLIPTLRPQDELAMRPLMLWWLTLFGLSIFARYEPGSWANALRIDDNPQASPLELLLEQALDHLPALIYSELIVPPEQPTPPELEHPNDEAKNA